MDLHWMCDGKTVTSTSDAYAGVPSEGRVVLLENQENKKGKYKVLDIEHCYYVQGSRININVEFIESMEPPPPEEEE